MLLPRRSVSFFATVTLQIVIVQYLLCDSLSNAASISNAIDNNSTNTLTIVTPAPAITTVTVTTHSGVTEEAALKPQNSSRTSRSQDFNDVEETNEIDGEVAEDEEDEEEDSDLESNDVQEEDEEYEEPAESEAEEVIEEEQIAEPIVTPPRIKLVQPQESTRQTIIPEGKKRGGGRRRKKKKEGKKEGMLKKFGPMMFIPFMIQSAMLPMVLITIKMMLLKTLLIGKLALILIGMNAFRRNDAQHDTSYSSQRMQKTADIAMAHYGYNGNEEYGAYVNKRSRSR